MIAKKKNTVLTFFAAFVPGAAEMYMGLMKQGISLLTLFLAGFCVPNMLSFPDELFGITVLIYVYSFFHARNLAHMTDEELAQMQDSYVWSDWKVTEAEGSRFSSERTRKYLGIGCIVFGIAVLWNYFCRVLYKLIPDALWHYLYPIVNYLPGIVLAIMMIYVGIQLIKGKKMQLVEPLSEDEIRAENLQEEQCFAKKLQHPTDVIQVSEEVAEATDPAEVKQEEEGENNAE